MKENVMWVLVVLWWLSKYYTFGNGCWEKNVNIPYSVFLYRSFCFILKNEGMNDIQTESVFVSNEILEKTKLDISLKLFNQ